MIKLYYFIFGMLVVLSSPSFAQVGGNQVYSNNNQSYAPPAPVSQNSIRSTDSTLIISAAILLNKRADYYLISVGASQIANTVQECNWQLDDRIDRLKGALNKLGINKEDIYVDFISQTKVYDHKLEGNTVIEFFDGFEIRKNLIIKTKKIDQIDRVIELSSKEEIYDIVKVDYVNEDTEKIYDQLFEEVMKIVDQKKLRFLKYSGVQLSGRYRIKNDNFRIFYPKSLYQQYNEAFETSTVNYYSSSYLKKSVRKSRTFYYDGMESKLVVDEVIDNISPVVGIQYVLGVDMVYELK